MRSRVLVLAIAATAISCLAATANASASQGDTFCTWGGTPVAPTGRITFSPGVTNTPSTGLTQFTATGELAGPGCTGKLTFMGYLEPGSNCGVAAPFHAQAIGLPPVTSAESQPGLAGTAPVLLYDAK